MEAPWFCVITDLEGAAGVDSFGETRTRDDEKKADAMRQLTDEVNACIRGIRGEVPDATVDAIDMHGTGGILKSKLEGGKYRQFPLSDDLFASHDYEALLFVGQHAMAGTPFAPLCHTNSSELVEYYRLNGTFIGEFGGFAFRAGVHGIPTIFLSGDDKATKEAEMFVPGIETIAVKQGKGIEDADHLDGQRACERIHDGVVKALRRRDEIEPLTGFEPPYVVEVRYKSPDTEIRDRWANGEVDIEWVDSRTVRLESDTFHHVFP